MNPREIFELDGTYFGQACIAGLACEVSYRKESRIRWMMTELNTFTIVAQGDSLVNADLLDRFSHEAMGFALTNSKGRARGFQSGVACCGVIVCRQADAQAIARCQCPDRRHFAGFEVPAIFETSTGRLTRFAKPPFIGGVYYPYLGALLDELGQQLRLAAQPRPDTTAPVGDTRCEDVQSVIAADRAASATPPRR